MRPSGAAAGAVLRTLALLGVILAVAAVPLLVVYRSQCPGGDDGATRTRWSFVPPFTDPPEECGEHESGLEVVLGEL